MKNRNVSVVVGVLIAGYIVLSAFRYVQQHPEITNVLTLSKYSKQIDACLGTKSLAEATGLETYTCAIEVATTIYASQPEEAIALCKKYSIIQSDQNVSEAACRVSIEAKIKRDADEAAQNASGSRAADNGIMLMSNGSLSFKDYRQYVNEAYGYSFEYDTEKFKVTSVGDSVFLRGSNPAYEIIVSPKTNLNMTIDEFSDFMRGVNEGAGSFDGWRGAEKVVKFGGYDAVQLPDGKVSLDYPSEFYLVEHKGKMLMVQVPFLGNDTLDSLSFF